jgi:hypothetical protein
VDRTRNSTTSVLREFDDFEALRKCNNNEKNSQFNSSFLKHGEKMRCSIRSDEDEREIICEKIKF